MGERKKGKQSAVCAHDSPIHEGKNCSGGVCREGKGKEKVLWKKKGGGG